MTTLLPNDVNLPPLFDRIGADPAGSAIMRTKSEVLKILIRDLKTPAANILKQDALSIGADLAVPAGVITCDTERVDAVLLATPKQLKILAKKELGQPFGLKAVAGELVRYLNLPSFPVEVMGILNANGDSFFFGSRVSEGQNALRRAEMMVDAGAAYIDLGGVSSRPGSEAVPAAEELARVKPVIDALYQARLYERAVLSLDSYAPSVLEYALDHGFSLVNDITGLADDEVAKVAAKYDATVCIMHMKGDPQTMQANPEYDDVIKEVDAFFAERIAKAKSFGIEKRC